MKRHAILFVCVALLSIYSGLITKIMAQNRAARCTGSFYPKSPVQLKNTLLSFFANVSNKQKEPGLQAIVVPHAGYVYSGQIAAEAYSCIPKGADYKNIFLIGPSHHARYEGASIYTVGDYITPLGQVKVNRQLGKTLIKDYPFFSFRPAMHEQEHCLEVQLPFLQTIFNDNLQIVPIIIGTTNPKTIKRIADALMPWFNSENLFVISSDFSHYPSRDIAAKADAATAKAFCSGDPKKFLTTVKENETRYSPGLLTSCCGESALLALLNMAGTKGNMVFRTVAYTNSGENPQYGDPSRAVGYWAIAISRQPKDKNGQEDSFLNKEEEKKLLEIARETLEDYLRTNTIPKLDENKLPEVFKIQAGAFVSLYKKNKELRGCIGRFNATEPLYKTVQSMAIAAATQDSRFPRVSLRELKNLDIEISVLTPLKRVYSKKEIKLGKHGIYIKKGYRSGTFLPQLAKKTGWTLEEFLGHCSRDKAGLGWDGWKNAEVYTYEAIVFGENE